MIVAGIILAVLAVIIGLIWLSSGTERPGLCKCEYGFTPNPHDGRCAVCRGWEP